MTFYSPGRDLFWGPWLSVSVASIDMTPLPTLDPQWTGKIMEWHFKEKSHWKEWSVNLAINCGVLFNFVFKGLHLAFKDKLRANFLLERANLKKKKQSKAKIHSASLVVQWLRIRLPMQGTQVWSLVWEDPTCHGTTKSVCHNYWSPRAPEPVFWNKRSYCSEKPTDHN